MMIAFFVGGAQRAQLVHNSQQPKNVHCHLILLNLRENRDASLPGNKYFKTAITKLLMACVCVVPKAQTKHKGTTSTADDRYTTLSVKTILTRFALLQT
jgi:hypothetical protein